MKKCLEESIFDRLLPENSQKALFERLFKKHTTYDTPEARFAVADIVSSVVFNLHVHQIDQIIALSWKKSYNFSTLNKVIRKKVYFFLKNQKI